MRYVKLTPDQVAAVRDYADRHGRFWRQKLTTEWMNATTEGRLQTLRNTHGPTWLWGYRLPR